MYLNHSTLENCRQIQNEFVKTTTWYNNFTLAAQNGNFRNLIWLKEQGLPLDANVFSAAAKIGNLKVLIWLKDQGCPWNEYTLSAAAQSGNLENFVWLKEQGCPSHKGFLKPIRISEELSSFLKVHKNVMVILPNVTREILNYIKKHKLYNDSNQSIIKADPVLKMLFGEPLYLVDPIKPELGVGYSFKDLQRYLLRHFLKE